MKGCVCAAGKGGARANEVGALRVLARVEAKLRGRDFGARALPVRSQCVRLVADAQDFAQLAKSFPGCEY